MPDRSMTNPLHCAVRPHRYAGEVPRASVSPKWTPEEGHKALHKVRALWSEADWSNILWMDFNQPLERQVHFRKCI